MENRRSTPPPIGHSRRPKGPEQWASANGRRDGEHGSEKRDFSMKPPLTVQLDKPGPPTGSNLHSVPRADLEERVTNLRGEVLSDGSSSSGFRRRTGIINPEDGRDIEEDISSLILEDEEANRNATKKKNGSRGKVKLSLLFHIDCCCVERSFAFVLYFRHNMTCLFLLTF